MQADARLRHHAVICNPKTDLVQRTAVSFAPAASALPILRLMFLKSWVFRQAIRQMRLVGERVSDYVPDRLDPHVVTKACRMADFIA